MKHSFCNDLRALTRLHMLRHGLTPEQMGRQIGASRDAILSWCLSDTPRTLQGRIMDKLWNLLAKDNLVSKSCIYEHRPEIEKEYRDLHARLYAKRTGARGRPFALERFVELFPKGKKNG